jgi:hypothetical protein
LPETYGVPDHDLKALKENFAGSAEDEVRPIYHGNWEN